MNNDINDFRAKDGVAIRKDFQFAKQLSILIGILLIFSVFSLLFK